MIESLKWRTVILAAVTALGVYFTLPTLIGTRARSATGIAGDLTDALQSKGLRATDVEVTERGIRLRVQDAAAADQVSALIRENFPRIQILHRDQNDKGVSLDLAIGPPPPLPWFLPKEQVHLGLDLQGGMHLVLEVEAEKAAANTVERVAGELRHALREARVRVRSVEARGLEIHAVVRGSDEADKVAALVKDEYAGFDVTRREAKEETVSLTIELTAVEAKRIERNAVEQAIETIRNRVDQFGVAEPAIVPQGERQILIQLPGIRDPERAIRLIGKTAQLEFRLVDDSMSAEQALRRGVPPGDEILYEHQIESGTRQILGRGSPVLVQKRVLMTGDVITDARVQIDPTYNEPHVSLEFDRRGAQIFERVTGENVNRRLAIVLDGVVQSAPVIREQIAGGRAQITGRFSMEEARDLAIALRSGSLPAPVKVLERRTVGPSLGLDSIHSGLLSVALGCLLVMGFMVVYYKGSGCVADLALFANLILILGCLALFRATLTLPGIAGIALTIGMAVDANVLINERIREEVRLGKSPISAVEGGYHKAFSAILDSNVTTLIAAAVLWQYGTGPIKGFAVTLTIGLLASMFTAIFGTRVIIDWILHKGTVKRLSI